MCAWLIVVFLNIKIKHDVEKLTVDSVSVVTKYLQVAKYDGYKMWLPHMIVKYHRKSYQNFLASRISKAKTIEFKLVQWKNVRYLGYCKLFYAYFKYPTVLV